MAGRGAADIVFVLDTSRSMEPCIEGVKQHIQDFVRVFQDDANQAWDLRYDFIAHDDTLQEDREAGVDLDFRERVVGAGGTYDDVDVRVTLIWGDRNDLDLHVVAPSGEEIFFGHKRSRCSGELDVDRNVFGLALKPVENIRWKRGKAQKGKYRVYVQNFAYKWFGKGPTTFKIEVACGGHFEHFEGEVSPSGETGVASDVHVCEFEFGGPIPPSLPDAGTGIFRARSVFEDPLLPALYSRSGGRFFTDDLSAFQQALGHLRTGENESPLVALDCALDLPWRSNEQCRRAIVLLTDEPVEGGNRQEASKRLVPRLIDKLYKLGIILLLVTPESEIFEDLDAADKCQWHVVAGGDGLATVDFHALLPNLAKSITVTQGALGATSSKAGRALFGQDRW